MLRAIISTLFVALALSGFAQKEKYLPYLSADTLIKSVYILASDSLEGRETGEPGQKKAADYILQQFSSAGLRPGKDTAFLQSYNLVVKPSGGGHLNIGKKEARFLKDYFFFPGFADFSLEVKNIHPYCETISLENKILLITDEGDQKITKEKLKKGVDAGASAAIVLLKEYEKAVENSEHRIQKAMVRLQEEESRKGFPILFVNQAFWDKSVGKDIRSDKLHFGCNGNITCSTHDLKVPVSVSVQREDIITTGENVIAYYQGIKSETIVITAHYDHLGIINDKIYYGADDNASGTAGIISLSKSLGRALNDGLEGRSVMFIAFSGEEKGLLGSDYYINHPFVPLEKTYANINTDMIGRRDKTHADSKPYIYVIGAGRISKDLQDATEKANEPLGLELDYKYDDPKDPNRFYYRSDHYNFARYDIPVVFFFNGVHEDYHKHTDTRDKILPELMEQRVRLAYYLAWELMTREGELKKNQVKE